MAVNVEDYVGIGIDPKTGRRHAINYLPKDADWEEAIYQFEQKDKLIGGVDGIDNIQAQQLSNRTEYLKARSETQNQRIEEVAEIAKEASHSSASVATIPITVPTTGWEALTGGEFCCYVDIRNEAITEQMTPQLIFSVENMKAAQDCGIGDACQTLDGKLRIYAMVEPADEIQATLCLFGVASGSPAGLPIASTTRAGIVRIGEGIDVTNDGTISAPGLADADENGIPDLIDDASATDEEVDEMLNEVYGDQPTT